MTIVLNGTSGVQFPLGTVSAPSLTNTTAQATGLYYPSSTTIGLSANGADAIRIDASQNVNLGTSGVTCKLYVSGSAASNIYALTDAATITPDFSTGNNFSVTLGGNRTLANPTNLTAGQSGMIFVTQDATGGRTLAYGTYWKFPNGAAPLLSTAASAVDAIAFIVRSTTSITAQLIQNIG